MKQTAFELAFDQPPVLGVVVRGQIEPVYIEAPAELSLDYFAEHLPEALPIKLPFGWQDAEFTRKTSRPDTAGILKGCSKPREIFIPNDEMQAVHDEILSIIATLGIRVSKHAFGISGGDNIADMVNMHCGNRFFFKTDIADAYGSVDVHQLARILANFDPEHSAVPWQLVLERFVFGDKTLGIIQGGKAAPKLFNIYMLPLDEELSAYAAYHGMTYTRYMDDFVFSLPALGRQSGAKLGLRMQEQIKAKIRRHQLRVNPKKTIYKDIEADGPIIVGGLQINNGQGHWQLTNRRIRNGNNFIRQWLGRFNADEEKKLRLTSTDVRRVEGLYSYMRQCRDPRLIIDGRPVSSLERTTDRLYWEFMSRAVFRRGVRPEYLDL